MSYDARRIAAQLLAAVDRSDHPDPDLVTIRKDSVLELAAALDVAGYTWEGTAFYERSPLFILGDRPSNSCRA